MLKFITVTFDPQSGKARSRNEQNDVDAAIVADRSLDTQPAPSNPNPAENNVNSNSKTPAHRKRLLAYVHACDRRLFRFLSALALRPCLSLLSLLSFRFFVAINHNLYILIRKFDRAAFGRSAPPPSKKMKVDAGLPTSSDSRTSRRQAPRVRAACHVGRGLGRGYYFKSSSIY